MVGRQERVGEDGEREGTILTKKGTNLARFDTGEDDFYREGDDLTNYGAILIKEGTNFNT
jgi:hypothetical protein